MTRSASEYFSGRLLAMGDIHGCARPLAAILDAASLQKQDTLVILGDFINRGPDSRTVIEILLQVSQSCELILIMGNHEEELLAARQDPLAFHRWLAMGGMQTLASYGLDVETSSLQPLASAELHAVTRAALSLLPPTHWALMEQTLPWWECENFFFTHAGYDPNRPLSEQSATELRWLSLDDWQVQPHYSGKTAIVGHTPNIAGNVVDFGFLRCLDTGCGLGGHLTLMDLNSGQKWRCQERSEKVIWD